MINLDEKLLLGQYRESKDIEIERLLSQYGTSLKDIREMYPQLTETIKQRQLTTALPNMPLFFTPSEAAEMGLGLQEGWMLKMTPAGEGYTTSFITPSKWEITENDLYISPTGEQYSRADLQALLSEPTGGLTNEMPFIPESLSLEDLTEEGQRLYGEYQTAGGTLDIAGWLELKENERLETEQVFGKVFPEQDIQEVLDYMETNPEGFLADLREIGPTEDVVALLKSLEFEDEAGIVRQLTDEEIQELFGTTPVPEYIPENWLKDAWDAFIAGAIGFFHGVETQVTALLPSFFENLAPKLAGFMTTPIQAPVGGWAYLLRDKLGLSTEEALQIVPETAEQTTQWFIDTLMPNLQERCEQKFLQLVKENDIWVQEHPELIPKPEYLQNPFEHPELFKDPGYWAYSISSSLAYSLSVMGTIVVVSAVATPIGGATAGVIMAGAPEAASMTEELVRQGVPFEEAVQWGELYGLASGSIEMASDLPFLGLIFQPVKGVVKPMWNTIFKGVASGLAKRILTGLVITQGEALEEVVTQVIHNAILKHYDETQSILEGVSQAYIQATIASLPFGAIGGYASQSTFRSNLSQETGQKYDQAVKKFQKAGLTEEQAQVQAANELARTPTSEAELSKAIEVAQEEYWEEHPELTRPSMEPVIPTELADKLLDEMRIAQEVAKKVIPVTPEVKQPWQMTKTEFENTLLQRYNETAKNLNLPQETTLGESTMHRWAVENALAEGKPVPTEVLADYPELVETIPTAEVGMPEAGLQPSMLEEVPAKEVRPTGKLVQARLDDYLRLREYNKQAVADRIAEIKKQLETKGRLPAGQGTKGDLRLELARLDAQQELDAVKSIEDLDFLIREVETELGRRSLPGQGEQARKGIELARHPRKPNIFPEYTSRQLEEMLNVYQQARQMMPEVSEHIITTPAGKEISTIGTDEAPAPEGATKRVFDRVSFEQRGQGVREKISQGLHNFNVKMVDDLYALKKFTEQVTKGGVKLSIEENPYLLARLLKGISGKVNVFLEYGTFGKEFWKIEEGRAIPNFTGESLQNILQEVKEPRVWQDFSVYLISRRSVELGERNIVTGITVTDALAAIEELDTKYNNFDSLAKRVYKYQDNLLVYCKEMGLISDDLLNKLRQYGNYVPFYRVFNELQAKGFLGKKMANIAKPIKRIKGSEREIINPLESIVKNTYVLIDAAERNQVGIAMANLVDKNPELSDVFERVKTPIARVARVTATELGIEIEGLSEVDAEAVVDIFRPSFFVKGDEVTVIIDGKKAYYKVAPDLRDALLNLDRESIGTLGNLLTLPAKWLRAGATLSPDFMVRNPARDAMTAFVYSNYNFLPGIDFLKGVAGIIGKDADYQLFKASGAEHSMLVSMDREYLNKTFKEIMKGKGFVDYIRHPLELFQIISELGEKATRLGEFKAGIRRGALPLEAGYSARSVTLDFAQAGTTAHAINRIIAFFNANIRGWGKMISSFKEHPVRTSAKVFLGITLPSILLYFANRDDDRWKEIPQWQKDLFWIIFTDHTIIRIPKPFELGIIFGSIPERFLEWLDNRDPELMKDTLTNLVEAGSPGFIPTALLPILEWMTNYSFFKGYSLVPTSRENMPPELQYTIWTSEVSKKLGELLKLSPAKIDNLIYGWTGGLGRYAIDVLDVILKKTGISPNIPQPSPALADIPVVKAFIVRNPYGSSGQAVESFYDLLEKYEQGEKYLKEMINLGEQEKYEKYKAAHPELLFFYDFEKDTGYSASARYLRQIAGELSELGKKQDEVYSSTTMTPDEKRKVIDEIDMLKTEVAHRGLNALIGDVSGVLSVRAGDADKLLGTIIGDIPLLSQDKPDIFNMKNLSSDYSSIFQGVKWEDISNLPNMPETVKAWFDKEQSEAQSLSYPNVPIYKINADSTQGSTFEDYYNQWQERLTITDPAKLAEFDKLYPKASLGNLTRRQLELLAIYNDLTPQEQESFLKEHPELAEDPREEWLKTHPEDNAHLALWGQEKIYTLEAYNLLQGMITELDIPDKAILGFGLPPKEFVTNYFEFMEISDEFGPTSAEAKLYKLDNSEYFAWGLEQGIWTDDGSDWNEDILRLQVNYQEDFDKYENYGDIKSPLYISNDGQRADAREAMLFENDKMTSFGVAYYTINALQKNIPENLVTTYVDYYGIRKKEGVDYSAGWYEDDWFLMSHPEFYQAMLNLGIWTEPKDFSKVPTKEVYELYQEYSGLRDSTGKPDKQARLNFRHEHPDLDNWLVLAQGLTPVGDRWTTTNPALANRKYWLDMASHYTDLLRNLGIRENITAEELTDYQVEQIEDAIRELRGF
jgi:hypothetical protein